MTHAFQRLCALSFLLVTASCVGEDPGSTNGSEDPGPSDEEKPAARFIGTWKTTTGTQTVSGCGAPKTTKNIPVTLSVGTGAKGAIAMTNTLAASCHIEADVSGNTATVLEGQSCISPAGDTYVYLPTSSFKLDDDGTTATVQLYADVTSAQGVKCSFSETDPFEKQ